MKRLTIISIFLTIVAFAASAQLLEDTDSKLKNAKVERGFFLFRNKDRTKSNSGIPSGRGKVGTVRYSAAGSPFRNVKGTSSPRYSSPRDKAKRYAIRIRYSAGSPFKGSQYRISPRYSAANPFRGSAYKVVVRSSPANPFRGSDYKREVRLSQGNPFKGQNYKIAPRYSPSNPFRGSDYKISPRYSVGRPFAGESYKIAPRYSLPKPFSDKEYKVSPRYSKGKPFHPKEYEKTPRYSGGKVSFIDIFKDRELGIISYYQETSMWQGNMKTKRGSGPPKNGKVEPRYSEGMPFRDKAYVVRPRYTGTKVGFFQILRDRDLGVIVDYHASSMWEGNWKVNKRGVGEQHPSSNYHFAMKFSDPTVRELLRQWNVYWTRLYGTKQNSKGVKKPVDKPKFDKKERVIWNN